MRKIYLESIPRLKAKEIFLQQVRFGERTETLPVADGLGRVTAQAVFAGASLPTFIAAAMDGIAVKASITFGCNDQKPLILEAGKDYIVIDTGDPLPSAFDAVIKVEDVQQIDENSLEIVNSVAPGQHVRLVGEDVVAGEIIVPAYHFLTPPDLGALLAGGHSQVEVLARPRVAIIPTGDELMPAGSQPEKGKIIEFNGTVIAAYLRQWGAETQLFEIIGDDLEMIKEAVAQAVETADIVIVNAGSSAGRDDYTVHVLKSLGEVFVHGVATRPGKPTVLGLIKGKPVLGLPGYPVSAYLALDWFAKPLIYQYLHQSEPQRQRLKVILGRRLVSDLGSEEFIRMTVGYIGGKYIANPLNRGAGVTMSLVKAHALLTIPAESRGYEQGEEVEIELLKDREELKNTLVAVGSHDLALDLLATAIRKKNPRLFLSSAHVGSMGGIMAIKKGEAHLAGVHLFHSKTGTYNIPYVEKFLSGEKVLLINLVYRLQGWMVERGNPLKIKTISDLVEKKVVFTNRQKGAGTRLLFDYLLQQEDLKPDEVYGYNREAYSHLNVAAEVASGTAQVGLGIFSAARAYDLDFIPVAEERYDLLLTEKFYESALGKTLREIINDPEFQKEVEALGGYRMTDAGKVFYSLPN